MIIDRLKSMARSFSARHEKNNVPVDYGKNGEPVFKEDIVNEIKEELERRRTERAPLELQWILNSNFLAGNQYCDINTYSSDIMMIPAAREWLERETFNQIAPLIETRIANLKKINYSMTVKPATDETDDYAKANAATGVLSFIQNSTDFERRKDTMIDWNELCGSCFWLSWWNSRAGREVGRITENQEMPDGGVKENERVFYEGELEYGLITPYELFPESIFKQGIENQRSIILEQVKAAEDVYDLYGIETEGGEVETFCLTPVSYPGGQGRETTVFSLGRQTVHSGVKVITYFERPGRRYENGRLAIIVGDELAYYGDLPYRRIPIVQVVCREAAGQFFGKSVIEDLIPRQRAYNDCINRIHEYIKRIAVNGWLVERGSVDPEEYEEYGAQAGALLSYEPGRKMPSPIPVGNLPGEVMTERYNLVRDMEYVAGVSQLTTSGSAPAGVTSGVAIEAIKATDDTRLSLTGDRIRRSVKDLAVMWLEIYKQYASVKRICNYVGRNNFHDALIFSGEDINSFDVEYTTENELLTSEETQRQRFLEAYNMGLYTDADGRIPQRIKMRALECLKMNRYGELLGINTLQVKAAERENVLFQNGILPQISDFDDHEIHYEEHLRYILQMDFQLLKSKKPQLAQALEAHAMAHREKIAGTQEQMMQAAVMAQMQKGR